MIVRKCANAPKCHNDALPGENYCMSCQLAAWQDEEREAAQDHDLPKMNNIPAKD